jgi:hypothetical protein
MAKLSFFNEYESYMQPTMILEHLCRKKMFQVNEQEKYKRLINELLMSKIHQVSRFSMDEGKFTPLNQDS